MNHKKPKCKTGITECLQKLKVESRKSPNVILAYRGQSKVRGDPPVARTVKMQNLAAVL
jgi:hypothetical protein